MQSMEKHNCCVGNSLLCNSNEVVGAYQRETSKVPSQHFSACADIIL